MKKYVLLLLILLVVLATSVLTMFYVQVNTDKIYAGIYVNDVDVSGLSKEQALEDVQKSVNNALVSNKIKLVYEKRTYEYNYKQLGCFCDYSSAVERVYKLGRDGNFIERYFRIKEIEEHTYRQSVKMNSNRDVIKEIVNNIVKDINSDPKDAKISYSKGKFIVTDHVEGLRVESQKLQDLIVESLNKSSSIEIPVKKILPKKTSEILEHVKYKIAGYSTAYSTAKVNRTYNIKRASSSMNGQLLMPGEIVSFNGVVGSRNSKNGYRQAKILKNGEYVLGMGGGVCQVSTTLYNAALLSDLEIIQRKNHSLPSSYVALGRDATVVYNVYDLKFRNNKKYPVYIMMYNKGNRVYASIYGDKSDKEYDIKITSKIIQKKEPPKDKIKIDKNLKPGQQIVDQTSKPGYKVVTYKKYYKNSKLIKQEKIHTDVYAPKVGIIRKGPDQQ